MPEPTCLIFAICQDYIEDIRSHNKTILNLFTNISVNSVPAAHSSVTAYVNLSNITTAHTIRIDFVPPSGANIIRAEGALTPNSTGYVDVPVTIRPFPIHEIGDYKVQLFLDDKPLLERILTITQA